MFYTSKYECRLCGGKGPFRIEYAESPVRGITPLFAVCTNCDRATESGGAMKEMEINFIKKATEGTSQAIERAGGVKYQLCLKVLRGVMLESSRLALASEEVDKN